MREIYRKFGSVVRRENDLLVRVDEAGEAVEESGTFACAPIDDDRPRLLVDAGAVTETADAIADLVKPPMTLERMIVSEGVAEHEFGEERWTEFARRIHVSIAKPPHRALIDLAEFSVAPIARVAEALARLTDERQVRGVRLAGNVGAALLPSLIGRIPMQQWAAPHDGKGEWVENTPVDSAAPRNWFRPSYRSRPMRAWFHLRANPVGDIDPSLPEAIALLAPIYGRTLRLLCVDGDAVFATTVSADRIVAVAPNQDWYPYAAGCFGADIVM